MRGVHVAHLEAGAVAAEATGSKGRQAALVGDLRQRVGLVHELGQLAGAEELLHGGDHGLAVDQVVGLHRTVGVLGNAELLLDGPLHTHQTHAEAVLQKLTHGPHAAVAQVVDVVGPDGGDLAGILSGGVVLLQAQEVVDGLHEVLGTQGANFQVLFDLQLFVELVPTHLAQVVLLGIEEHPEEQLLAGLHRGGLAGTDLLEELLGSFLAVLRVVLVEGLGEHLARGVGLGEAHVEGLDIVGQEHLEVGLEEGLVGFHEHFTSAQVDDVLQEDGPIQHLAGDRDFLETGLLKVLQEALADLLVLGEQHFLGLGVLDVLVALLAQEVVGNRHGELALLQEEGRRGVEVTEHGLVGVEVLGKEAQGAHERGAQELALAVDAGVEQALGVQLELDPGAAVGDDLGAVEALVRGDAEEHAGAAVQLAHDHALGAVDDEGAAVGHDRQVAEVDLGVRPLLEAADALVVLVPLVQAHPDLEGGRQRRAALHALVHAHLLLHGHGFLADVAEGGRILVAGAALGTVDRGVLRVVRDDAVAAVLALGAEVVQAQVLLALASPVAHGVVEELDFEGGIAAVRVLPVVHGEHGLEDRLQPAGLPLAVQQVHLQELVIAPLLDVDQVRDGNLGRNL